MKPQRFMTLILILMLALTALACNVGGLAGGDEATDTPQPSAETESSPAAQGDEAQSETTESGETQTATTESDEAQTDSSGEPASQPAGNWGMFANEEALDSYRMRTEMDFDGQASQYGYSLLEQEWVRDPAASRMVMYDEAGQKTMESISIGDQTWIDMGDGNWIQTQDQSQMLDTSSMQVDLAEILENLSDGLQEDGKEKINGINCKRYLVDASYSMDAPLIEGASDEMLQFMPQSFEGQIEGTIWVADEPGLAPVIVKSDTSEELILSYAERDDETMAYTVRRELFDINQSINITPPENATIMPTVPAGDGAEGGSIEVASPHELDSFRLEWSTNMETQGTQLVTSYSYEWTSQPEAWRLVIEMDGNLLQEVIMVDGITWTGLPGGTWMKTPEAETDDAFQSMAEVMEADNAMVLVGSETMNGIQCQHYVSDLVAGGNSVHREIWVANQQDLSPVIVRGLFSVESELIKNHTEGNLVIINGPISIEPPQ